MDTGWSPSVCIFTELTPPSFWCKTCNVPVFAEFTHIEAVPELEAGLDPRLDVRTLEDCHLSRNSPHTLGQNTLNPSLPNWQLYLHIEEVGLVLITRSVWVIIRKGCGILYGPYKGQSMCLELALEKQM